MSFFEFISVIIIREESITRKRTLYKMLYKRWLYKKKIYELYNNYFNNEIKI